ncbi:MAG: thymidine phosphorylase [candidate division KSB1 bacterium]|nr:thymidine phosphorylase [candidate division KSB1 bacterium]MDZ7341018.1 thymidine phosphorylase [candidate division KSB1 bacterium]
MTAEQIIIRKRDGEALSEAELRFMVEQYVAEEVPDYQMAALLMAIYFQGMSFEEMATLTKIMVESGARVDLSHLKQFPIDKHSTGGVGDKISLVLAPLMAAAGVAVPMMSGRGLGHSGGTLDKLEAIPGFRTNLTLAEYVRQLEQIGVAMIGQTAEIVPADRKIYALRDRTGTVPSIPLVVASILSKKIAEGARALVLDVKTGRGAFFPEPAMAMELARNLIAVSAQFGLRTTALLTGMDQPLGYAVGNWLETREAIDVLRGGGPSDVRELTLALGAEMLFQAGLERDISSGLISLRNCLASGAAYERFLELVMAQGGDVAVIENSSTYPFSCRQYEIRSQVDGYVHAIDALQIGILAMEMGAGRIRITDTIDYGAGIVLQKKVGDPVTRGELLAELHYSKAISKDYLEQKMAAAIAIAASPIEPPPLILAYIHEKGQETWPH